MIPGHAFSGSKRVPLQVWQTRPFSPSLPEPEQPYVIARKAKRRAA